MKTRIMASVAAAPSSRDESDDETENLSSSSTSSPIITTVLHPDIIHTHILTRLDGPTLAAASSVSSELRHLCTDDHLWRNVCTTTWPSLLDDPIASHVISTFPGGHRSFFSDAFPSLHWLHANHHHHHHRSYLPPPLELISAVDIYCQGKPVFSRVRRTETQNNRYPSWPLWVDILDSHEMVPIPVKFVRKEKELIEYFQENFTLSWILIDPNRKRAANLSSSKPVSVRLTSDVEVVYAVVMAGEDQQDWKELVRCVVKVTCCGKDGKELHVKKVTMVVEDMDGCTLKGREGVMILQRAMENGDRKKVDEVRAKDMSDNFVCKIKQRREIREKKVLEKMEKTSKTKTLRSRTFI